MKVYCKNIDRHIEVDGGTSLAAIAAMPEVRLDFEPVCCRVNNKTEDLGFVVYQPKLIEFQGMTEGSGPRVYTRSLCMMLYRAVCALLPGTELVIEHSIAHGFYCRLAGRESVDSNTVEALQEYMLELHRRNLPFERHEAMTSEAMEIFERSGLQSKVRLLRTTRELFTTYYTLDGVADSYYGALAPSTGHIGVFALHPYKKGFLLIPFDLADPRGLRSP